MSWKEIYQNWKNHPSLEEAVLEDLQKNEKDTSALEDAFYAPLEFGTAGMRGIIGAGINRMNVYTVRQATEGLARFIEKQGEEAKKRGVAIAYDSRHMSPEFSIEAAKTLGAHGIKAYVFESLRPTPELSFAVRQLRAVAGIMITASHNPSEYNGYKVYGEDGGQLPPKEAGELTEYVRSVENILDIEIADEEELKTSGLLEIIGKSIDKKYLEYMKSVTIDSELVGRMANDLKIVFTPLHGTGQMLGEKALYNAGFRNVELVPEQAKPDPDFSTVKSPNPEDPAAFEKAIELGREIDADILIATDPDADRLGMAVKTSKGHYELLSGNQIASLMLSYLLEAHRKKGTLPSNSIILKSLVSTEMTTAIADKYGVPTVNTLTGFKFIAEKIKQYEKTKSNVFMFGFEESYGYLLQPFVRDKDAIQALVFASEMAGYYKEQGFSCLDALQELYHEYGHFKEKTISIKMEGIEGAQKIKDLMKRLREETPERFGEIKVESAEDYLEGKWTNAQGQEGEIDLPKADVLKYKLMDQSWIAARPSGTEPKIKFYIAAYDGSGVEVERKIKVFEEAINELTQE